MKICCSFSLTKLMQNCSKPFFCGGTDAPTRTDPQADRQTRQAPRVRMRRGGKYHTWVSKGPKTPQPGLTWKISKP